TIDWGEGDPQEIHLNGTPIDDDDGIIWDPEDRTFSVKHLYTDDNPTETASDSYNVQFTVTDDDDGSDSDDLDTTVNNVAPGVELTGPGAGFEGSPLTYTATVEDASPDDDLNYTWTVIKDGLPYTVSNNTGTISDNSGEEIEFTF